MCLEMAGWPDSDYGTSLASIIIRVINRTRKKREMMYERGAVFRVREWSVTAHNCETLIG